MTLRSRMTQNIRRQDLGKLVSQELAGHSESFLTFAVFPRRPPQRGFMILNIDSAALRVAILLFRLSTIAFRQRLLPTSGSSDPTRVLTVWLATALTVAHWRAYMRCAHTQGTVARVSQFLFERLQWSSKRCVTSEKCKRTAMNDVCCSAIRKANI